MGTIDGVQYRRPPTAHEAVLQELRRWIVRGVLPPGSHIRPDEVAGQLATSRVPVREALKTLEGEGLVLSRPHRGYFVADLSYSELEEIYRIRDLLEREAVRKAVPRMTDAHLKAIRDARDEVEQASEASEIVQMAEANRAFHFGIYDLSGMPRLCRMIRLLWDSSDAYRALYFSSDVNRQRSIDEHREIVKALERRATTEVVRLLAAHAEAR